MRFGRTPQQLHGALPRLDTGQRLSWACAVRSSSVTVEPGFPHERPPYCLLAGSAAAAEGVYQVGVDEGRGKVRRFSRAIMAERLSMLIESAEYRYEQAAGKPVDPRKGSAQVPIGNMQAAYEYGILVGLEAVLDEVQS